MAGTFATFMVLLLAGSAWAVPRWWHAPAWWLPGALCVHSHESGNWHIYNPPYANGFQFTLYTWQSVGGSASNWVSASPREQLYRAWLVWKRDGGSWREWPNTSRMCGLR